MAILPRIEVAARMPDAGDRGVSVDVGMGGGGEDIDIAAGPLAVKVGLAGLLAADSPVERLLHGPDALARFRSAPAADPSPMATRGMTIRVGDIHAEIATRHDIGGTRTPDAVLRADTLLRANAPMVTARVDAGADTRAVPAVRDVAEAAALPQRIEGAAGLAATARVIDVAVAVPLAGIAGERAPPPAGIATLPATTGRDVEIALTGLPGTGQSTVALDGLVNILGRAGTPVTSPQDAPPGAVLVYQRADGGTAVELRTTTGFAGVSTMSATPLTGAATAASGEGFTLIGVFVPARDGPIMPAPFNLDTIAPLATTGLAATATTATTAAAAAPEAVEARTAGPDATPPPGTARSAGDERGAPVQPAYANAVATSDLAGTNVRPDGSTIPAGLVVAQEDARPSFGEHASDPASDRPYVHAIWYDILALRFADAGIDLLDRSTALRDVVWATAIEHGPFAAADGRDILSTVARALDLTRADDAAIIAAIFAERTRTTPDAGLFHFPEVLPFDRDRVVARLNDDAETALARLTLA